jgi:hypothetical protein
MEDRATIARLLPPALLDPKVLTPILADSTKGHALALDLFEDQKGVPCDGNAITKTQLRAWIASLLFVKDVKPDLKPKLATAYLRCFTEPPAKGTYTEDEMSKLATTFKDCIKAVLEHYSVNEATFSTDELENLLCLPAMDVVKKGSIDVALCLQLFQNTVMNGDVAAFQAFYTKNKEVAALWPFSAALVENVTRDIAAKNLILLSTSDIKMQQLYAVFGPQGKTSAPSEEDVYKFVLSHKVIKRLLFQDSVCKLDEVQKCITPCVGVTAVKFGGALTECQQLLSSWRDNLDSIINATSKVEA